MIPDHFRQNSRIREDLHFRVHTPDTSCSTDFSKTHKLTQDLHSWTAITFVEVGKLLRRQTNSQIRSNLHFCVQKLKIFDNPIESKLSARGKPSTWVTARDDS